MNDTFWIKEEGETLGWSDVSPYSNAFNTAAQKIAFSGEVPKEIKKENLIISPEITTGGNADKCWVNDKNGISMKKFGSTGFANSGKEPYCEVYASQLAKRFLKDFAEYKLVKMVPVFDFNLALLLYSMYQDYKNIGAYINDPYRTPCIGSDFAVTPKKLLTPSIREDLIKLKNFSFDYIKSDKMLPEEVNALNDVVVQMINVILDDRKKTTLDIFPIK